MGILTESWQRDQAIGLAATATAALYEKDATNKATADLARWLAVQMESPLHLSLGTISQVARVPRDVWSMLLDDPKSVQDRLAEFEDARHKMMARRVFIGHALTVLAQPHVGLHEFVNWAIRTGVKNAGSSDVYWKALLEVLLDDDASARLEALRRAALIDQKLRAIDELYVSGLERGTDGKVITDAGLWFWLCQGMFSHQFCWPLLSAEIGHATFGISLPMVIVLTRPIDGFKTGMVYCRSRGARYMPAARNGDGIHRFTEGSIEWRLDFHNSLQVGLQAGNAMWQSQNGRAARAMRLDRLEQNLTVDFTWAQNVAGELPVSPITLRGRSAELYFSQVVLARQLESEVPIGVATGTIDLQDRMLPVGFVNDVDLKIQYARDRGDFSRVVLPAELAPHFVRHTKPALDESHASGRLEINYCPTARSAADAMQRGGWRRTHFLHAPEERFCFHEMLGRLFQHARATGELRDEDYALDTDLEIARAELPVVTDSEISALKARTRRWLSGSDGIARRKVDAAGCRPRLLGPTLAWLDHTTRIDASNNTGPGLGIVVARFNPGDHDLRFWSRLFQTMGVHPNVWREFQWATVERAREIIAGILNNFGVNPLLADTPPPDLLVILDEVGVTTERSNTLFPEDFRGQLFDILNGNELSSQLEQRDAARTRALGKTRILVLQVAPRMEKDFSKEQPPDDLRPLAIFRAGFSVHLAAAVWQRCGVESAPSNVAGARERLDELRREGWLGRHRGEYYLRWDSRPKLELTSDELRLHLVAAKAWAPILDSSPVALLSNRDSVFETYALDEAIWHLRTVTKLAVPRMRDVQVDSRTALRTALALLPSPDWDLAKPLMGAGPLGHEEALDLAEELLTLETEMRGSPAKIHSSRYALAINIASRRLGDVAADTPECVRIQELAAVWYTLGRKAAGEHGPQLLKLMSEYARFLRVWETLPCGSPQAARGPIEQEIDERIERWKKHRHRADAWKEAPLSIDWLKLRMDDDRPEDVRSLDARLGAELWQDHWREPWLMLLGLMVAPRFATAQFAGVFNLLGDSPATRREIARKLGRSFRLSTYKKADRAKITDVIANVLQWLFVVDKPLVGEKADAAVELIAEWIAESHNCFDVAQLIPDFALTEQIVRDRQDERLARLAEVIFRDSWGCWSYLSRLPDDLRFASRRAIVIYLANCAPAARFGAGLEIGDIPRRTRRDKGRPVAEVEVFWPDSIPSRYSKARRLALQFLKDLRPTARDPELRDAVARLTDCLTPIYPTDRTVGLRKKVVRARPRKAIEPSPPIDLTSLVLVGLAGART